jgi:hypothetical protein
MSYRIRKRPKKRTITVDGVVYTWKYARWVEIRRGREVVLRRSRTNILGITDEDLGRGMRKGNYYPLTPARVAALIKEVTKTCPT